VICPPGIIVKDVNSEVDHSEMKSSIQRGREEEESSACMIEFFPW